MKKILIIEYSHSLSEDISILLTLEGFIVFEAKNGLQGIEVIEEEFPDLILCDVYLPDLNGFTILEKLRNNPATSNIPFIFLTSMAYKEDIQKIREYDAEYLVKPVSPEILVNKINNQFKSVKLKVLR